MNKFKPGQDVHVNDGFHSDNMPFTINEIRKRGNTTHYVISCGMSCEIPEQFLSTRFMEDVSDGYHTFGELYEHRMILTATICQLIATANTLDSSVIGAKAIRSWKHHPDDSLIFDDMFIVVITLDGIGQISYHYNKEFWPAFDMCRTEDHSPKYDDHTPSDVITRLAQWNMILDINMCKRLTGA